MPFICNIHLVIELNNYFKIGLNVVQNDMGTNGTCETGAHQSDYM